MSDAELRQQILAISEMVKQLAADRLVDEQLILALLRAQGTRHELAVKVREIAERILADTDQFGLSAQARIAVRINAALEALGESPGIPDK